MAGSRPNTLAAQGLVNILVRGLLRVPLLSRVVGKRLITVYAVGRKSGKRYTVPVAFTPHEGALLIGTPFRWAHNLRTGEPVEVRFRGRRKKADVRVETGEKEVTEGYAIIARDNRQFADFNHIGFDGGEPRREDPRSAWEGGARLLRLTLRDDR